MCIALVAKGDRKPERRRYSTLCVNFTATEFCVKLVKTALQYFRRSQGRHVGIIDDRE